MVRQTVQLATLGVAMVAVVQLHYLTRATCPAYDADYRALLSLLPHKLPEPEPEQDMEPAQAAAVDA